MQHNLDTKSNKNIIRKENHRPISLMSIYSKILNQTLADLYKKNSSSWSNWVRFKNCCSNTSNFQTRVHARITISLSQYNAEKAFAKIQNLLMSLKTKTKTNLFLAKSPQVLRKLTKSISNFFGNANYLE